MSTTNTSMAEAFQPQTGPTTEELAALLRRSHVEEPVFYWPTYDMYVVTRYEDVRTILMDDGTRFSAEKKTDFGHHWCPATYEILANTSRRDGPPPVMGLADGDEHRRLRDPFKSAFTPRAIAELEPSIRQRCHELIDRFIDDKHAEFHHRFSLPYPLMVILDVLGLPHEDADLLHRYSDHLTELLSFPMEPDEEVESARSAAAFEEYIVAAIERVRREGGHGLLADVVRGVDDGRYELSMDEMVGTFTQELTLGGHETGATAMTKSLYHLLADRSRWESLCADPSRIRNAVEECLRFDPPVAGLFRTTKVDVEIAGTTIPKGARVYWNSLGANYDGAQYEEATTLTLDRSNAATHFSFGAGPHHCIGAPLSRAELRIAYEVLVERLPTLRLAPGQGPIRNGASVIMRTVANELHVEWD